MAAPARPPRWARFFEGKPEGPGQLFGAAERSFGAAGHNAASRGGACHFHPGRFARGHDRLGCACVIVADDAYSKGFMAPRFAAPAAAMSPNVLLPRETTEFVSD